MNNHQFIRQEMEAGRFAEYVHRGLIGVHFLQWEEIYDFHQHNPKLSTWEVANNQGIDQKHVRNIYRYMEDGEKD